MRNRRLWAFTAVYFCVIIANATVAFWGPTIIREAGVSSVTTIGWIISGASLLGSTAMILNGFIADRAGRPLIQCAASLVVSAVAMAFVAYYLHASTLIVIVAFAFALAGAYAAIPVFWQLPNRLFAGTAAAGGIAIINSFGNLGGFLAPYGLGLLATQTGDVTEGLVVVSLVTVVAALGLILVVRRFFSAGDV
jgi:MFS family permease